MKLSLITLSLTLLVAACGNDNDPSLPVNQAPKAPPAEPAPAAAPARTIIAGNALPTSPVNLIADPGFGLASEQGGFGSFLAFEEATFSPLELGTTVDSRSPAGFAGAIAIVKPEGTTNKQSEPVLLLTSFQGGEGPFHAKVWVSKSDVAGKPVDLGIDAKGIQASITDGTPDGEAFDLTAIHEATRTAGGRTWTLLRGEITKPIVYGGFFVVRTGTGGGQFLIAAPEIVAQPLVAGLTATRSLSPALRARTMSSSERSAIMKYKSKPPRLVPASSNVRR